MAIISGVTVDWRASPRIITIPSAQTEVTIEDLQDTLLDLEDDDEGMLWEHLRNTSGGEDLGGGVSVAYTMELQNAKIAFESLGGPSTVAHIISGGNLVAVDDLGASTSPIEPTQYTQVTVAQSTSASVSEASTPTAAEVADAVWDESVSGHTTSGSFGKLNKFIKTLILGDK